VFLPLTKAHLVLTFCNSPHLSRRVGLNLFNVIELASFYCFLQLWEQEEVAWSKVRGVGRVWERWNVVFCQKFICGDNLVGRDIVMVQDPFARVPLLGNVWAQCRGGIAGLFCRIPYLLFVL
jgi:hypothetical protein